jgi:hypothetical protein
VGAAASEPHATPSVVGSAGSVGSVGVGNPAPAAPGEDVRADPEGLLFGTDKSGEFFDLTVSQDSGHL